MQGDSPPPGCSSSGLLFQLHPLVLINISDHHTRTKANAGVAIRVAGCLLGQQIGRTIDISNSFEVVQTDGHLDEAFLAKKLGQYKQTFPALDLVGWYATGSAPGSGDLAVHRKMMLLNEAPVFLQLNPSSPRGNSKELPVALYETELRVVEGQPSFSFVCASFSMATSEAERVGVNQVTKILPAGGASGATHLAAQLTSVQTSAQMLVDRAAGLASILAAMQSGDVPLDPQVVRRVAALTARLPVAEDAQFAGDSATEGCDALMSVLLAGLTRASATVGEVVDRHIVGYERTGPVVKRSGKGAAPDPTLAMRMM